MNIAIIGASGTIGQRIVQEALRRGHGVRAVMRNPERLDVEHEQLKKVKADVMDPASLEAALSGTEAVISAYGPQFGREEEMVAAARTIIEGTKRSGITRLLIVGGAGSLIADSGIPLMDTPEFPEEVRPLARAHADAYELYKDSGMDWTYVSPAAIIEPGKRTGNFRIGMDRLVTDETGSSRISVEDYAAALIDELDDPQFVQSRFTVGY
ncbi:NAD(P)H-binding protein [Paenibacillus sp. JCM 10914]|uniref:NAD(P)-dependent oxidoreductase n=1 Tax=Paenibacillus sp. JCM 10914 TaxID=1236974 RepID=UPI0003CC75F4|nr:NAD(P)-dependent oxidoreductase [Paenibacillus sp. JCM 10914]GAE09020.1 Rrf2-linked NADH-flavin reductase [Paenibacillus sp. JCM 10914]